MPSRTAEAAVVVFFGLTGSGKSYLAGRWAAARGCAYLNSDEVRKQLAGVAPESRHHVPFNEGLYSPEMTSRTYRELLLRALAALRQPGLPGVVLDGSYGAEDQRREVVAALGGGCPVYFIHCHCREAVTRTRLARRAREERAVSDGRWEIYVGQQARFSVPDRVEGAYLLHLDTDMPVQGLIGRVDDFIATAGGKGRAAEGPGQINTNGKG